MRAQLRVNHLLDQLSTMEGSGNRVREREERTEENREVLLTSGHNMTDADSTYGALQDQTGQNSSIDGKVVLKSLPLVEYFLAAGGC